MSDWSDSASGPDGPKADAWAEPALCPTFPASSTSIAAAMLTLLVLEMFLSFCNSLEYAHPLDERTNNKETSIGRQPIANLSHDVKQAILGMEFKSVISKAARAYEHVLPFSVTSESAGRVHRPALTR